MWIKYHENYVFVTGRYGHVWKALESNFGRVGDYYWIRVY
jgi:hypothetical protein